MTHLCLSSSIEICPGPAAWLLLELKAESGVEGAPNYRCAAFRWWGMKNWREYGWDLENEWDEKDWRFFAVRLLGFEFLYEHLKRVL